MKSAPDQTTIESARDKAHVITHSAVDVLLSRLDRVKRTGPGNWTARCSAHTTEDQVSPVRELDDGRILLHCFAGCDVHDVLAAVDLNVSDLFPPRAVDHRAQA
jgi:hypothetical protein